MDSRATFYALAGGLVLLTLLMLLPLAWRARQRGSSPWPLLGLALLLPALAGGLYAWRGNPGALDDERQALSQHWLQQGLPQDEQEAQTLYARLQEHLARQPTDPRALVLKARLDMRAQRYPQATEAFKQALAGRSKAANDAGVWVEYAEAVGMAQGGTLVGEPQQLVQKALSLDAHHAQALDLAGSAAWEMRDFAQASQYWQRLLEKIPPGSPRHAELSSAIQRAQQRAKLSLPPPS